MLRISLLIRSQRFWAATAKLENNRIILIELIEDHDRKTAAGRRKALYGGLSVIYAGSQSLHAYSSNFKENLANGLREILVYVIIKGSNDRQLNCLTG